MADRPSKAPSRVTVEDLLRLKRAERPPPEFWNGFELELRQRQLAALVERKPWWNALSVSAGRLGWLRLPVGATAVFALTLFSVRQFSYVGPQSSVVPGRKSVAGPATSRVAAVAGPMEIASPVGSAHAAVAEEQTMPKRLESSDVMAVPPQVAPRETVALVSRLGDFDRVGSPAEQSPLSGSLDIQLATASSAEPALIDAVPRPIGFEERSMSTLRPSRTAEVLPTAVAVTGQRCSRLLAALGSAGTFAPEPSAPEHAKRSVIRYLAEDGWDRSMSRLQADADRLSIRF